MSDEKALKTAFAEALLRTPDNSFKAALSVIADTGKALQIASLWPEDEFVRAEMIRLISEHDPKEFLPSKSQQAKALYQMAEDQQLDEDTRLKAHALYAQIMGHIEKNPGVQVNVQNNTVLRVPVRSADEWEHDAVIQQRTLISDGANATS